MATRIGGINTNSTLETLDDQGTTSAPGAAHTITVTADRTIKRYTGIDAALAFNITPAGSLGQTVEVYFSNDAVLGRLITFGANIQASAATLLLTVSKEHYAMFKSNGTKWLLVNVPIAL